MAAPTETKHSLIFGTSTMLDTKTRKISGFIWNAKGAIDDDLEVKANGEVIFTAVGGLINHTHVFPFPGRYTNLKATFDGTGAFIAILAREQGL